MLLALVLVTLFDRVDAPREPASTAEGGDVVFILFVGLTTLCGISNFQVNCGASEPASHIFLDAIDFAAVRTASSATFSRRSSNGGRGTPVDALRDA